MIASIILQLTAEQNGRIQGSTGRAVHAFWFNQWQQHNPALATTLHQPNQAKPFTVSPLLGLPRPRKGVTHVRPGDQAWVRFTTLHPTLTQHTLAHWLPTLPSSIELAGIPWCIKNIALMPQEHEWAAQTSYAALRAAARPAQKWQFQLKTPLTIHISSDGYMPFPLPGSLLKSWHTRWHSYAPAPLPPIDLRHVQDQLFVSGYRLNTVPVRHGRRVVIGCVGDITLRAGKLDAPTRRTIDTLARYATYCGGGSYTAQGMGNLRLTIDD